MGHLVTKARNSGKISYSGTQYVNPINGTKRLCIRTGTKPNDIIKYGLTTNSSASEYCGMRMKIDGNTAYIGRSEEPFKSAYNINSVIKTSRGTSTYQTYYKTIQYTLSYSSTYSSSNIGGMKTTNTYIYSSSYITSVNNKQCTYSEKCKYGTMYTTYSTIITLARRSTVELARSIDHGTYRAITRTVLFDEPPAQDENNFNI